MDDIDAMAQRMSKWRYDSRIPSESETIRRLLTVALDMVDRNQQKPVSGG